MLTLIRYWVDFCTDKDVNSKNCLNICRPRYPFGNVRVTPCDGNADSELWCCGDKTDCCSTNSVVMLAQVLGGTLSSNGASSSVVATSSSLSTGTPTSASASSSAAATSSPSSTTSTSSSSANESSAPTTSSSGLSKGAIAGIAIGAIAGVAILAAAAIFLMRRAKKSSKTLVEAPDNPPRYHARPHAMEKEYGQRPVELPHSPAELGSSTVAEMPSDSITEKLR